MTSISEDTASKRGWFNFNLLWSGQTLSLLGSQFVVIGMPLLAVQVAGATPSQAVLLPFLMYLPFLLIGLPAGALVDRMNKRRLMVLCDAVQCAIYITIFAMTLTQTLTIHILMVMMFFTGCANVFFQVSYTSLLPNIFRENDLLQKGNSRLCFSESMVNIVGPFLAGPLISLFGIAVSVLINAASFFVSLVTLSCISFGTHASDHSAGEREVRKNVFHAVYTDVIQGIRFVFHHDYLQPIYLCGALYVLFLTAIDTSLVLYCKDVLGLPAYQIGIVVGAAAAGFPLANLLSSYVVTRLGFSRTLVTGATVSVIGLLFIPVAGNYHFVSGIVIASIIHGFGEGIFNPVAMTFRQKESPANMIGRVNAVHRFLIWGAISLGSLMNSFVIHTWGLEAALWAGGAGTLTCLVPLLRRGIRKDIFQRECEVKNEFH